MNKIFAIILSQTQIEIGIKIPYTCLKAKVRMSRGSGGRAFTSFGIFPAPTVVNTVGAGDSFIAGFLYGILQGWQVEDCLRKGAEVAAQVVQVFEPWVNT